MESHSNNKIWLFCPKCGETIPEIYFSNSNRRDLIDFRCNCEIKEGQGNHLDCTTSLDPITYLKYCEEASSGNQYEKVYCLHCNKWLGAVDVKLHKKIIFTYPHLFADCEINIGTFCEELKHYQSNQRVRSKFFCETHALHICSTCNEQHHALSDKCVVHSLETMRNKVNNIYINLITSYINKGNKHIKLNDKLNDKNKVPNIFQLEMRDFFVKQLLPDSKPNFTESVGLLLYHLFNLYFYISESHFPNYNLAKSILNLNLNINANNKHCNQITLHPASINYYQVMNYYPKKYIKENDNEKEKQINKVDVPFSSQIKIISPVKNVFQFVFINDNVFKIGEIYYLGGTKHEMSSQRDIRKTAQQNTNPLIIKQSSHQIGLNDTDSISDVPNTPPSSLSHYILGRMMTPDKSFLNEHVGSIPKDELNISKDVETTINESKSEISKDKQIERKFGLEINYKPIPNSIKLIQFIKMDLGNALLALCSEKDGNKEHYSIKKFVPIINEKDNRIIGYKFNMKDYVSMVLRNDFVDFRGLCEYTAHSKEQNKKESEWKCLCFGNQILRISYKENKKFEINSILKFKDIFRDGNEIWKNFTHFIPFPINDESSVKLLSIDDSVSKTFVDTVHIIVENGTNYSKIHSFVIEGQEKPTHFYLLTTSTSQTTSICYLEKNIIAVGGIDNKIELIPIDVKYTQSLRVSVDKSKSEILYTHHKCGIHCIAVMNDWFISGGGNGSLIIWNIEKRQMLNIIHDELEVPITSIMNYNCPFGPNTLLCCFQGKGINFWSNESDNESQTV